MYANISMDTAIGSSTCVYKQSDLPVYIIIGRALAAYGGYGIFSETQRVCQEGLLESIRVSIASHASKNWLKVIQLTISGYIE